MSDTPNEQKNPPKEQKTLPKGRIHLLDELRGFAVVFMVCYHALYTIGYFFGWTWGMDTLKIIYPFGPYFAGLFIVIAGISSNLSHSNIDRGARLFFIAFAVTLVSYICVGNDDTIRFGILHMFSVVMMLYGLTSRILKVIPYPIGILFNLVMFILTYHLPEGKLSIPFIWEMKLPVEWYQTDFLYPLGFIKNGFSSGDFFPLFPWMFLFFAAVFFGRLAVQKKLPKFVYKSHVKPLAFIGKHSLLIYLLHQPVIFGICKLAEYLINLKK